MFNITDFLVGAAILFALTLVVLNLNQDLKRSSNEQAVCHTKCKDNEKVITFVSYKGIVACICESKDNQIYIK